MLIYTFEIIYLVGLVLGLIIRGYYARKFRQDRLEIFRKEGPVIGVLASLWGLAIFMPVLSIFTTWMNISSYQLPSWTGWLGAVVFSAALWLLWRSHYDLGRSWSVTTEIKNRHKLVTEGVFRYIRHPMYSAHFLWGIAQVLLIHNWITGPAGIIVFIPLYILRVKKEERMMLEEFGEEYRSYMKRTGRLIPRL